MLRSILQGPLTQKGKLTNSELKACSTHSDERTLLISQSIKSKTSQYRSQPISLLRRIFWRGRRRRRTAKPLWVYRRVSRCSSTWIYTFANWHISFWGRFLVVAHNSPFIYLQQKLAHSWPATFLISMHSNYIALHTNLHAKGVYCIITHYELCNTKSVYQGNDTTVPLSWVPAFAGMTTVRISSSSSFPRKRGPRKRGHACRRSLGRPVHPQAA